MSAKPEFESTMLRETMDLLRGRDPSLSYRVISEQTGLPIHWLHSLGKSSGVQDPGVRRVETLHRFLSEQRAAA